ncbi:hypothetical protein EDD16DRAFT_1518804 [Pisolithus croceorrhizus]|nr:hypothetical protein EDD16DRAFT_1518804 [Pisolithus croceorrhizus]
MFVKNSLALQDTVDRILTIFETLIVNSGGLDEVEKLEQWRNAVRDIQWELESVRSIANRTDNIPHMLIGMDKFDIVHHTYKTSIDLKPVYSASHGSQGVKVKPKPPQKERWPWQKRLQYLMRMTTGTRVKMSRRISKWMTSSLHMDDPKNEEGRHPNCINPLECLSHNHKRPKGAGKCSHDELDQMIRCIDEGEQQITCVMCQIVVPTPGTVEDHMYTVATLAHELEAFWVNLQHPRQVQDNSMQTPQADTSMTMTTSHVVELQDENVGSPHSESETREVMPTHGEPPAVNRGVELLVTESSDNGGQGGQGEEADIVEGTAVAGEAQSIIVEEGGIGGEHHQMTEENSGECLTEAEGGTTILVSEGQVAEVSGINTEEELVSTGGKFLEEH